MMLALSIYGVCACLIFIYIVYSAIFWDGKHDKLIPYYFGVQLDLSGWRGLLQAFVCGLLWLPLLCVFVVVYFKTR